MNERRRSIRDSSEPCVPRVATRVLIIGVGNDFRGDDAAGLVVVRKLREMHLPDGIATQESDGGAALIEKWEDAAAVILIDAVSSGAEAGTICRFDLRERRLPGDLFNRCSTHALSLADSVELARALERIPQFLIMYGIEGKQFDAGIGLSAEVEKSAQDLAQCVFQEIQMNYSPHLHSNKA
jgi:hydrogenase maturation protease